ncbi:MAG: hypothetical protein FWE91_06470 [Defluviitaleaceae bacterium]|nr:hypothetical protein [Defluviitaleaceae bacterium]
MLEKLDIVRVTKDGQPSPRPCTLNNDEFEFHKAFAVACGGMILSGDLLYEINAANIEVLKKLMADTGEAAVFDDDSFEVGRFKLKNLLCLFNWGDVPKTLNVSMDGKHNFTDFFTNEEVGDFINKFSIEIPAHSGRVIKWRTYEKAS